MDRSQLVLGVHVLVALGLLGIGALRASAGNTVGGGINVLMAAAVVYVGVYFARRE